MSSFLLPLAQVTEHAVETVAAHGEGSNAITQLTDSFGISVPFILAQVVSFSVVAFVLWKFAFKPVLATLDERKHKIAGGLQYAEEMKTKLEAAQQQTAAQLKDAQIAASKIIDEARKLAKELAEREAAAATERSAAQLAKAQQAIELEHKKMLDEARNEIARLVIATTERVLAKKLSDSDRASYNEAAARELTTV
ncbi:MAG: F0F1 ATP synthase subunit B [Opitutaceae bacterium]|jgi:F-type H+-transporting ATPase subunit b